MKILRMYDDLLDLYGDGGNFTVLKQRLESAGEKVTAECRSAGDEADFSEYALVYISPGLAANLEVAAADFAGRARAVREAEKQGTVFFYAGNAQALFGRHYFKKDGSQFSGIGVFDEDRFDNGKIVIRDMLCRERGSGETVCGFLNTTVSVSRRHSDCWFDITRAVGGYPDTADGQRRGGFYGTSMLGPLLVRNPGLMRAMLERILKRTVPPYDDSLETEAYRRVVREISGR